MKGHFISLYLYSNGCSVPGNVTSHLILMNRNWGPIYKKFQDELRKSLG